MELFDKNKRQFISKGSIFKLGDGTVVIIAGNQFEAKNNEVVIAIYKEQAYYEGEQVDGVRSGKGVLINKMGQYYCG